MILANIEADFETETAISMYPLLGFNFSIKALRPRQENNASGLFATLMFDNNMNGKFLTPAHPASNGFFYILDTFLKPPSFSLVSVKVLIFSYKRDTLLFILRLFTTRRSISKFRLQQFSS